MQNDNNQLTQLKTKNPLKKTSKLRIIRIDNVKTYTISDDLSVKFLSY